MNQNFRKLALLVTLAVVLAGGALAVSAASSDGLSLSHDDGSDCGNLRMDEFYACHFGGWQPTPAAEPEAEVIGYRCDELRLDEYYACLSSGGWRPGEGVAEAAR